MDDKISMNTRVYTDIQSLNQLKNNYGKNEEAVKKEVSQQFEAILMQMVMSSMRDANKAFASSDDGFSSDQMSMYQDMFDKQLSLMMSNSGLGFANIIEKNIDQQQKAPPKVVSTQPVHLELAKAEVASNPTSSTAVTANVTSTQHGSPMPIAMKSAPPAKVADSTEFKTPEDFIKKLWSASKVAAESAGLNPELLLAQAALETNWGKSVLSETTSGSSHNLFNIKADPSWNDKTVSLNTLEQSDGMLVKQKASFRSYNSFQESFSDYVNFLKTNNRYSEALGKASNPSQFISSLQQAGYATDPEYAGKVMKIFKSQTFQQAISKVKSV